jgi:lipopolysaccharide/colanic/teichoic acid biosynthesis glycosyltransferase
VLPHLSGDPLFVPVPQPAHGRTDIWMTITLSERDLSRPDPTLTDLAHTEPAPRSAPVRKRALDLALGVPLTLLALPLIAVFAIVLAIQLRDWPFFSHDRIGRNGRHFSFPKLRTLPRSTPAYADKVRTSLEPVSRFATALRKTHLDELPQLLLVVTGRMSLVGPRPLMRAEAEETPWADVRALAPQGCTGLWQVGAHQAGAAADTPGYDLAYLDSWSLRMDLWILWRTALQLIGAKSVELSNLPTWVRGPGLLPHHVLSWVVDHGHHLRVEAA